MREPLRIELGRTYEDEEIENRLLHLGDPCIIPWKGSDGTRKERRCPERPPLLHWDGQLWTILRGNDDWMTMGYIPVPSTRFKWLRHHFLHGVMMGFPLKDVIVFVWRARKWSQSGRLAR